MRTPWSHLLSREIQSCLPEAYTHQSRKFVKTDSSTFVNEFLLTDPCLFVKIQPVGPISLPEFAIHRRPGPGRCPSKPIAAVRRHNQQKREPRRSCQSTVGRNPARGDPRGDRKGDKEAGRGQQRPSMLGL